MKALRLLKYIFTGWAIKDASYFQHFAFSQNVPQNQNTGTPLIGRFLGPGKKRFNRNPSY